MRRAGSRPDLSRVGIIGTALELIDKKGLAALNMRSLGAALGAATMSVYRHFRNKAELLDGVVDHLISGFAPTSAKGGWQIQARLVSLRVRSGMLAHPELAELIGREFRRSPTSLRVNTDIIERLRLSGVPPSLLPDIYWAISSYTTGYALLEAQTYRHRRSAGSTSSQEQRTRKLKAMLKAVEEISPSAAENAAHVLSRPLDDEQFLFGLDCLISGIELRVVAQTDA